MNFLDRKKSLHMKRILIVAVIATLFAYFGYLFGASTVKTMIVPKQRYNEDMLIPYKSTVLPFTIEFADSVEGRPTYNITFSDNTGLDSMYPEEIAVSLITGKWQYNEDFAIDSTSIN